ncbi:MAG: glycosyltransferase family 4 protein [Pseudanabaenales cyanobacterium]|nr:glycosyltransferase family 4 protein [Pseudanabaenales cyanobacterium]
MRRSLNILLTVHYEFNPNAGAAGVIWNLGQEYQKLGHQVQYYSLDDLPHWLPGLAKTIMFPEFVAHHIWNLSNKQAVHVVDASTGDTWVWAKILQRFAGSRPILVARDHGLRHIEHLEFLEDVKCGNRSLSWKYPLYRGSYKLWEEANSLRTADLVLLLSHRAADYAVDRLGVQPEQTRMIANGIPESFLNLPFEPTPAAADDVIRIAQVSTYIPRKGIRYGSPALNRILARYPQVQVSFLGTDCSECPNPNTVYADFDPIVRDRIKVIPRYRHETLPTLLKGHQIKILPSTSEGFGIALVEAMACGLAPVTTATPGPMAIVRDGDDAIVVPPRDSEAIEQAIERLIRDRAYLNQLRRNAYATAQNYSWTRIARDTLAFYEDALRLKNQNHHPQSYTA